MEGEVDLEQPLLADLLASDASSSSDRAVHGVVAEEEPDEEALDNTGEVDWNTSWFS